MAPFTWKYFCRLVLMSVQIFGHGHSSDKSRIIFLFIGALLKFRMLLFKRNVLNAPMTSLWWVTFNLNERRTKCIITNGLHRSFMNQYRIAFFFNFVWLLFFYLYKYSVWLRIVLHSKQVELKKKWKCACEHFLHHFGSFIWQEENVVFSTVQPRNCMF